MPQSGWLEAVLEQYEASLVRYASRILGNSETAREVVQDTFLRLCRTDRQQVEGHLAPWLFKVCRNRAFDVRQKESLVNSFEISHRSKPYPDRSSSKPLAALERKEVLDQVQRALTTLPARQRELLSLKFEAGLSYKEIGNVMGLSVSNVGFILHMAIRTVRRQIRKESSTQERLRRVQ